MIRPGSALRKAVVVLALLLVSCKPPDRPLAVILSVDGADGTSLSQTLAGQGFDVVAPTLPCEGKLTCWADNPGVIEHFPAQLDRLTRGRKRVVLVGVSRGGYLALRAAHLPQVTEVVALSPVTDLNLLSEFEDKRAHSRYRLDPAPLAGKRLFVAIGSGDARVSTRAALDFVDGVLQSVPAGRTPDVTVVVNPTPGHRLMGEAEAVAWVRARRYPAAHATALAPRVPESP